MRKHLAQLETRLEALVEGTFTRWFADRLHPRDITVRLTRALEDSAAQGTLPATVYTVRLHPADLQMLLHAHPALADTLAAELVHAAREARLTLARQPEVLFRSDASLTPRSAAVTAEIDLISDPSITQGLTPVPSNQLSAPPAQAFITLDGRRTVPLTQPVLNIGRKLDNQLVLDDPRVSRLHAQLRVRCGRYVLYDLGSHAGTFVNDQRVTECVLQPGDVISLGGALLLYGEGTVCQVPELKPEIG